MSHLIEDHAQRLGISARFAGTKLIEGDADIIERLGLNQNELELMEHSIVEMEHERGLDRNAALAEMRYTFIEKVCEQSVVKCHESKEHIRSLKIDSVLTNKYLALPLFLLIMLTIFWLTFGVVGSFLSDLMASGIDLAAQAAAAGLEAYGINPVVESLVEDTGYMARVAFVMDKLLRKIGLSGRSFVPMLIGFGCSVPAIMASRTLSSERDRRMTILLTPFMSCSAKIPIYAVFAAAFFQKYQPLVMIGLYVFGMLVGIVCAIILEHTVYRGNPVPFVMELPNYRFPSAKSVLLLMWDKAKDFIQKAFTIIFAATVIIWFLQTFDLKLNVVQDSADSLLALVGKWIAPVFRPLGFEDWRVSTALITGFTAKEAVVSTMSILLGTSMENLGAALSGVFTPVTAISFLVFTLLYTPCVAAIAAIRRELASGWKAAGVALLQCMVAWMAAFFVYQALHLFV